MAKPTTLKTLTFSGFEIKDADKGEVTASFATLGVVDHDGDIIRRGALPKGAKAVMSRWGHDSVWGERPVGKGTLVEDNGHLVFNGRVFLNTNEGRETFGVLKEMGGDQEWSFGFRVTGWEAPSEDERKGGAVRIITKMAPISEKMFEVSPVLAGAGINTRTMGVKQADGDPGEDGGPTTPPPAPDDAEVKAIVDRVLAALKAERDAEAQAKADAEAEVARKAEEEAEAKAKADADAEAARKAAEATLVRPIIERFNRNMHRFA